MCFAVQVCKKVKHGTRGDVTVFAPVVSSVIVFKLLRGRGRRRSWGADKRLVSWQRWRLWGLLRNKDGGESTRLLEVDRIHWQKHSGFCFKTFSMKIREMKNFLPSLSSSLPEVKRINWELAGAFKPIATSSSQESFQKTSGCSFCVLTTEVTEN